MIWVLIFYIVVGLILRFTPDDILKCYLDFGDSDMTNRALFGFIWVISPIALPLAIAAAIKDPVLWATGLVMMTIFDGLGYLVRKK